MINLTKVKRFCKDYTKIENYEEAVKDTTQTWHCHHKKGKHLSEETRKKISEAEKGRTFSEEHRKKISESNKGKKRSEETRIKMSAAAKRRWAKGGN